MQAGEAYAVLVMGGVRAPEAASNSSGNNMSEAPVGMLNDVWETRDGKTWAQIPFGNIWSPRSHFGAICSEFDGKVLHSQFCPALSSFHAMLHLPPSSCSLPPSDPPPSLFLPPTLRGSTCASDLT